MSLYSRMVSVCGCVGQCGLFRAAPRRCLCDVVPGVVTSRTLYTRARGQAAARNPYPTAGAASIPAAARRAAAAIQRVGRKAAAPQLGRAIECHVTSTVITHSSSNNSISGPGRAERPTGPLAVVSTAGGPVVYSQQEEQRKQTKQVK
jgi:hypothetical protein